MSEPQTPAGRKVTVQKIYLADASVEVPDGPGIFSGQWRPEVNVDLNFSMRELETPVHQVTLRVTVTAKRGEGTAYIVEVQQAGVFHLTGFDQDAERKRVLGSYCPSILFPYAREAVGSLVQRAGFPHFLLQPMDFDALYRSHLDAQARRH